MPPKCHGSKAPIKGSRFRFRNGDHDENLLINPPIQPPNIPKALVKASMIRFLSMLSKQSSIETCTLRFIVTGLLFLTDNLINWIHLKTHQF